MADIQPDVEYRIDGSVALEFDEDEYNYYIDNEYSTTSTTSIHVDDDDVSSIASNKQYNVFDFAVDENDVSRVLHDDFEELSEEQYSDLVGEGVTFGLDDVYDESFATPSYAPEYSRSKSRYSGGDKNQRSYSNSNNKRSSSSDIKKTKKEGTQKSPKIQPQWAKEESANKPPPPPRIPGGFYDLGGITVNWDDDNVIW
jgi:hypothetical protein